MGLLSAPLRKIILGSDLSRDPLYVLAGQVPAVDWRFARDRSLRDVIRGIPITFTRTTTDQYLDGAGTLTQAAINEAVFPYSSAGASLGLQVQEARTNLLLRSRELATLPWTASIPCVANTSSTSSSLATGRFSANGTTNAALYQSFTCTPSTVYTFSFLVSLITLSTTHHRISGRDDTAGVFVFDEAPVVTPIAGTTWGRVVKTFTTPAGCTVFRLYLHRNSAVDAIGILELDQAQVELGPFATSPIPTAGSTVQRTADVATVTGTDFSSWYRQEGGVWYMEGLVSPGLSSFPALWTADDGTANNRCSQYAHTSGLYANVRTINVSQGDPGVIVAPTVGSLFRLASRLIHDNLQTAWNGVTGAVDSSASMPTALNRMVIGANTSGGTVANTTISRLCYFPPGPAADRLQRLTA